MLASLEEVSVVWITMLFLPSLRLNIHSVFANVANMMGGFLSKTLADGDRFSGDDRHRVKKSLFCQSHGFLLRGIDLRNRWKITRQARMGVVPETRSGERYRTSVYIGNI